MDDPVLDNLFMELASETRRSMLKILKNNDEKLSKIAEKLGLTIQDALGIHPDW
jgi:predicted transcriptional regulator